MGDMLSYRSSFFYAVALLAFGTAVVGCGGGGGGGGQSLSPVGPGGAGNVAPSPTPTPTLAPTFSTSTQAVTAAGGGSVVVTLGATTATVAIPAGTLSADAVVSVVLYQSSALTHSFASIGRRPQAVPAGSTVLAGISVNVGAATVLKPLKLSLSGIAQAAGTVARLAVYNTVASGYLDVDTATVTAGVVANDLNPLYPGPSKPVGANTYVFYTAPSANVAAAPVPTFAITPSVTPIVVSSTTAFSATESDAYGDPYLNPLTLSADAILGTATATAGSGTLSLGASTTNASGKVRANDPISKATGSLLVDVISSRPDAAGDTFAYSGTLTEVITRPLGQPTAVIPPVTTTTAVSQSVKVDPNQTYTTAALVATPGLVRYTTTETDTTQLQSSTTTSKAYFAYSFGAATQTVSLAGITTSDTFGVATQTSFPGSYLVDTIPQIAQTFTNSPALTYSELDPDGGSVVKNVDASGAYTYTLTYPDTTTSKIASNVDGSGSYSSQLGFSLAVAAPVPSMAPSPAASAAPTYTIPLTVIAPGSPNSTRKLKDWYPGNPGSVPPLSSETDTVSLNAGLSGGCSPGPIPAGPINVVVQTIKRFDPMLGTLELQSITQDVSPNYGVVCMLLSDSVQAYYDYTLTSQSAFASVPQQLTTINEVLSVTAASVAGTQGVARRTSSIASAFARASFGNMLERRRAERVNRMRTALPRFIRSMKKGAN